MSKKNKSQIKYSEVVANLLSLPAVVNNSFQTKYSEVLPDSDIVLDHPILSTAVNIGTPESRQSVFCIGTQDTSFDSTVSAAAASGFYLPTQDKKY